MQLRTQCDALTLVSSISKPHVFATRYLPPYITGLNTMALVQAPRMPTHSRLLALPPELLHHILTFLDLQSLLACSRVRLHL
jgi:hypothetical protein